MTGAGMDPSANVPAHRVPAQDEEEKQDNVLSILSQVRFVSLLRRGAAKLKAKPLAHTGFSVRLP